MAQIGRPSKYSEELTYNICNDLKLGLSLRKCSIKYEIDFQTILNWLDKPEFFEQYVKARKIQLEVMADEIIEIGEEAQTYKTMPEVVAAKLRADNRKWLMSKLAPKRYGDKLDITTEGEKINKVSIEIIDPSIPR